jgi:hypothetical protein
LTKGRVCVIIKHIGEYDMSKFSKILSYLVFFGCIFGLIVSIVQHDIDWTGWCTALFGWILVIFYERKM